MIKKVYMFDGKGGTLLRRVYAETVSDEEVREMVASSADCNFVGAGGLSVVFKRIDTLTLCFVAEDEDEMYVYALLTQFSLVLEQALGKLSGALLACNFKDCHMLLDGMILDGKVISLGHCGLLK